MKLTIATRTSPLAMWQAEFVRDHLRRHHPSLIINIIGIKTLADKQLNTPLDKIGGKGIFVKELEQALLNREADLAVHSLKDVPATFPEGLGLGAICQRENPLDAWICPQGASLEKLSAGSRVGTSSLRRMVQLKMLRPDLHYVPLRGNVDTRLRKCQQGEWDAIVLAVAGLSRLKLTEHITQIFSPQELLPAVGQGALGIECRLNDDQTREWIDVLDHPPTRLCIEAERAMNAALGGNCQVPVAGYAVYENENLVLTGRVGDFQEKILLEARRAAPADKAVSLGESVAQDLMLKGAEKIIANIKRHE